MVSCWVPSLCVCRVCVAWDLPFVSVPVCFVSFGQWLKWDLPQGGVPVFPRPCLLQIQLLPKAERFRIVQVTHRLGSASLNALALGLVQRMAE